MQYLGLGAEIAASLLIPIAIGYILDDFLGTSPTYILIGVLGAMVSFGFMIARISKKLNSSEDD